MSNAFVVGLARVKTGTIRSKIKIAGNPGVTPKTFAEEWRKDLEARGKTVEWLKVKGVKRCAD